MKELETVKFVNFKAPPNSDKFGMELVEDRADCQVGTPVKMVNGKFTIAERRWDGKILHLTLQRDRSNRKGRRKAKVAARLKTLK